MAEEQEQDPSVQEEVRQIIELLRVITRLQGVSNAALARKAGVPLASLVRYFKGKGEPKIEFLIASLRGLGLGVREFFELAYPPQEPSAARVRIETLLGPLQQKIQTPPVPAPPPPTPGLSPGEMERMLLELHRDVRRLIDAQAARPSGETETDG